MTVTDIALIAAILLALGYVLLGALIALPWTRDTARPLLPILNSETVIAIACIVPFLLPPAVRLPLLVAFAARILWEAGRVAALRHPGRRTRLTVIAAAALVAAIAALVQAGLGGPARLAAIAAIVAVLVVAIALSRGKGDGPVRLSCETALFPALPLGLAVAAAMNDERAVLLLAAFILVETFDSYALLGGKLAGRHKAFPRLSPNKTIEGLVIGAAMLLVTALALAWATGLATLAQALVAAMVAAVATVAGDLSGSRLKRASGVKDYPTLMRHQGGALDIADAAIMAAALIALTPP